MIFLDIIIMLVCLIISLFDCFTVASHYCTIIITRFLFTNAGFALIFACIIAIIKNYPFFRQICVADINTKNLMDSYFYVAYFTSINSKGQNSKLEMYIHHLVAMALYILLLSVFNPLFKQLQIHHISQNNSWAAAMIIGLLFIQLTLCIWGVIWRCVRIVTNSAIDAKIDFFERKDFLYSKIFMCIVLVFLILSSICIFNLYIATTAFTLIAITALFGAKNRKLKNDWSISVSPMFIDIIIHWIVILLVTQIWLQCVISDDNHIIIYLLYLFDFLLTALQLLCTYRLFWPITTQNKLSEHKEFQ